MVAFFSRKIKGHRKKFGYLLLQNRLLAQTFKVSNYVYYYFNIGNLCAA